MLHTLREPALLLQRISSSGPMHVPCTMHSTPRKAATMNHGMVPECQGLSKGHRDLVAGKLMVENLVGDGF